MISTHDSLMTSLRGPVPLARMLLRTVVGAGHSAVDATCGNGNDTLLLADLVGAAGHVWGFDIQSAAIAATRSRLEAAGMSGRVTLLQDGHEEMARYVTAGVQAVLFNLGYLPGGDHSIVTRPGTTVRALDHALNLLAVGGLLLITIYPGHEGGAEEQQAVEQWGSSLSPRSADCWRMSQTNHAPGAPYLLLVQRSA